MRGDHHRFRRWNEQAFLGKLAPRRWERLRTHLAECHECRAHFDRLGHVRRVLGAQAALPGDAMERIGAALRKRAASRRRFWIAMWGLGSLAAAAAAGFLLFASTGEDASRFAARGGRPEFPGRSLGARILCVSPVAAGEVAVTDATVAVEPSLPAPSLRCKIDAGLQFTYSTPASEGLHMLAYGRGANGITYWYVPRRSDDTAAPLAANAVDEAIPWSTRLGVKHRPGRVDVTIRFYDAPVVAAEADVRPFLAELHAVVEVTP